MRIVFDVNRKTSVVAGSEPWTVRVGEPPARTFKANVTIILESETSAETVEFEGDSVDMLHVFRTAVEMLESLQKAHEQALDRKKPC